MVDILEPKHRGACTHFLSWTWQYRLSEVRSALREWLVYDGLAAEETFLFMCFFVNNQFRMLIDKTISGSSDLESIFEGHLTRIQRMVALLDDWDNPVYLTRVWTIYEQYTAAKLDIPVTMILPPEAKERIKREIYKGEVGILAVRSKLMHVRAEDATATYKQDEVMVKAKIHNTFGFEAVNTRVRASMVQWIALMVKSIMTDLVLAEETKLTQSPMLPLPMPTSLKPCSSSESWGAQHVRLPSSFSGSSNVPERKTDNNSARWKLGTQVPAAQEARTSAAHSAVAAQASARPSGPGFPSSASTDLLVDSVLELTTLNRPSMKSGD